MYGSTGVTACAVVRSRCARPVRDSRQARSATGRRDRRGRSRRAGSGYYRYRGITMLKSDYQLGVNIIIRDSKMLSPIVESGVSCAKIMDSLDLQVRDMLLVNDCLFTLFGEWSFHRRLPHK